MSATPSTTNPPEPTYPERTQADQDAMFASVVWFRTKLDDASYEKYKGKYVAILGEQIIDSDPNDEVLGRRIEAMHETIPINRVVLQYVHKPEDWNWK